MVMRRAVVAIAVAGLIAAGCDSETDDNTAERQQMREEAAKERAADRRQALREHQAQRRAQQRREARQQARKAAQASAEAESQPTPEEPEPASDCEAGYDPCVPTYPPDLDCPDVGGPIAVSGSDPHGFDADGDGIGCEP